MINVHFFCTDKTSLQCFAEAKPQHRTKEKLPEIIPSLFLLLQNEIEISHENPFPTRKLGMKNVLVRFCSLLILFTPNS